MNGSIPNWGGGASTLTGTHSSARAFQIFVSNFRIFVRIIFLIFFSIFFSHLFFKLAGNFELIFLQGVI
jgi:hypothetical protein